MNPVFTPSETAELERLRKAAQFRLTPRVPVTEATTQLVRKLAAYGLRDWGVGSLALCQEIAEDATR